MTSEVNRTNHKKTNMISPSIIKEKKLRIGIITYDFYPPIGGQGVETYELYNRLMKNKEFEVFVLSSSKNNLIGHKRIRVFNFLGLGPLFFSIYVNFFLKKIIKKHGLDIFHVYGGPGGVLLLRKPSIPLVYTANHTYSQQFRSFKRPYYKISMLIEKIGFKIADKIIAISSTTKDSVVESYKIKKNKVKVIPIGVDTQVFRKIKNAKRIKNSILFVGRLDRRKGLIYVIRALSKVKREIQDVTLYIIGQGKERARIEQESIRLGIRNNIIFLGSVDNEELVRWYNKANIVVVPSILEGFGIVCIEAMACGTPVIGTRVPGIVDIVKDNKTGFLIESQNSDQLREAIIKLLNDKDLQTIFSQKGLEKISREFRWKTISENIIKEYKGLLN